ncbi:MAG: tetratricopeptide repeat protein [Acidobacteria bacterium]|nr:tetratricopeptide repeat protein [Acidobacteriota bacterium]
MEQLLSIWTYLNTHQKLLLYLGIGVVAVVLGYYGYQLVASRSAMARTAALNKALEAYSSVDAGNPGEKPPTPEEINAKLNAALKALDQVARDYPSSPEGLSATILKASCLRRLGKLPEAEAELRKVIERTGEDQTRQVARMSLAETLRLQKKYDDAVRVYDELGKEPRLIVSKENLLLDKAQTLEEAGKLEVAYSILSGLVQSLEKVKPEDEEGPAVSLDDVRARLESLKTKMLEKGIKIS